MRKKIISLLIIFVSIFLSYSIYFYYFKTQRAQQGEFVRRFVNPPKEIMRKDLDPAGLYFFAGKNKSRIWLGSEKNPLQLLEIKIDKAFSSETRMIPINASFEKGQLTFVNFPVFIFTNGRRHAIQWGAFGSYQNFQLDTLRPSFDIASAADDSAFWLRASTDSGFQLAYKKWGDTIIETNFLTTKGRSNLSRDGMLVSDETSKMAAYVYYYRNSFLILNTVREHVITINTIDTMSYAQVDVGKPNSAGVRRKSTSTISFNYRADFSDSLMYIYSRARSSVQADIDRDSIVFDVYSARERNYISSFLLAKKYNNETIQDFRIVYPYIFLLLRNNLIIMKM